uniref:C-type lectin domain-containing protein n=1 Tax=Sinocyclocheilus grahami TaxID=75366 RepID=A0A672QFX7_SINGR
MCTIPLWTGFACLPWCSSHRYYIINEFKNWTEAQNYCRKYYYDLATFDNKEEHDQVVQTLRSGGYTGGVWIGLYDDHDWKWSDQSSSVFRAWKSSEPNNFNGIEFCAHLSVLNAQWNDISCSFKHRYAICKDSLKNP